jgi:hypothetical protein
VAPIRPPAVLVTLLAVNPAGILAPLRRHALLADVALAAALTKAT